MVSPESRLFCQVDHMPGSAQELRRLTTLAELGLLEPENVPIFEEAAQTAAHFVNAPIGVLGVIDQERQWFKAAVGLSRIGLMNDLASSRQLSRSEAFCTHVVDSRQTLIVHDAAAHPAFSHSLLIQRYGIRAYLGVPLFPANGCCLGALCVMDLSPREFTLRDIELLELTARWCMSEYERNWLLKSPASTDTALWAHSADAMAASEAAAPDPESLLASASYAASTQAAVINSVKAILIAQMTQELSTPLTSILGMASVLNREIYGPLTGKQKEYLDIIHNSGQYLHALVTEIIELGGSDDGSCYLNLSPVDIEMLCQQALSTLDRVAQRREQQVRLTVEPGRRIWLLDKDKVRQMLYHLVSGVIQVSSADSIIRIHVSRKPQQLNLSIWTSHPWLGEGLPQATLIKPMPESDELTLLKLQDGCSDSQTASVNECSAGMPLGHVDRSRQSLEIMLSCQLAELHGGNIALQGSAEAGYRYVVSLPQVNQGDDCL